MLIIQIHDEFDPETGDYVLVEEKSEIFPDPENTIEKWKRIIDAAIRRVDEKRIAELAQTAIHTGSPKDLKKYLDVRRLI
jgi:hypothetical protein